MPRLFSYTVRYDDGAAPNPFNGMCTLAICKPGIRAVAKEEDWVAGIGPTNGAHGRDLSYRLVYAMRVEEVLSLGQYYEQAAERWPHRIPNVRSKSLQERLGDCIYFTDTTGELKQIPESVHDDGNRIPDVSGKKVLISRHFYYFGREAILLPDHLHPIRHPFQGHKSTKNAPLVEPFINWIEGLKLEPGQIGWPDHMHDWNGKNGCGGCYERRIDDAFDPSF